MPRIIDVIDHTNVVDDELAYREPQQGSGDWRMGSQVIVGESQVAIFVRAGEALDALGPGRHTLSTANLPILSGLIGLATSGRTPFTADLYFINQKDMPQVGWGTNPPIPVETPGYGYGATLVMTHGVIDIGVDDPMRFLKQYAIGKPVTRLSDIKDRIQTMLVGEITQIIMNANVQSINDANRMLSNIEGAMLAQVNEKFVQLGLRIKAFESKPFTEKPNVTRDELRAYVSHEVWERLMEIYERERRLDIAEEAAKNPGIGGAAASAGVGFGVGQQIGQTMNPEMVDMQRRMAEQQQMMQQMMMQQMMQNQQQPQQPAQAAPPAQAAASNPQTKEEIQQLLDTLDARLMSGEISETIYNRLVEKWTARLDELGG
jgi:membrane protease subunit (stomatin/prohibitin family)